MSNNRECIKYHVPLCIPLYHDEQCSHLGRYGETQDLLHYQQQSLVFESMKELYHFLWK